MSKPELVNVIDLAGRHVVIDLAGAKTYLFGRRGYRQGFTLVIRRENLELPLTIASIHKTAGARWIVAGSVARKPHDLYYVEHTLDDVGGFLINEGHGGSLDVDDVRHLTRPAPVTLAGRDAMPTVGGRAKPRLSNAQYDVVLALLDAGDAGLNLDALLEKSGHNDARGILRRLKDSDPDWGDVIHFGGKPGGGYRIA